MDADARALAGRVKARHARVLVVEDNLGIVIGGDSAHCIVGRRVGGDQVELRLQALVHAHEVGNVGDLLVQDFAAKVAEVQVDVVLAVDAAALFDLLEDAA